MNFIVMLFYFAIYTIIVLVGLWMYEKFFKKIPEKQRWDEYVKTVGIFPQTAVNNTYLLKAELTSKVILLLFFLLGILFSLTTEADSLDEFYRRMALGTAIFGFIFTLVTRNKILHRLITNKLSIREDAEKIIYDYITEKGELKTDVILKNQIKSIKWSIFPYASKNKNIWITELNKDSKRWAYVFAPFYLFLSAVYWLIYLAFNKLQIGKYILFRTDEGIFAIPSECLQLKNKVDFEWKSLINRFITNGGNYAN
ncbi:MAG: hypothetical protein A3K14_06260 [Sulfurimonas sp. RIFCSPLOWO2_12_FULL_36_74]|nr:MAG: hypothetical protein A3K14_06260 [Sulfurimonas sp. RIFCSPLOWO2_12_FULL_36_74]